MNSSTIILRSNSKFYLVILLILTFFFQSCGKKNYDSEMCDIPVSQQIDNLLLSLEEGEEISKEDRNRIYDLAWELNEKYKGEMDSDEIIKVVE